MLGLMELRLGVPTNMGDTIDKDRGFDGTVSKGDINTVTSSSSESMSLALP